VKLVLSPVDRDHQVVGRRDVTAFEDGTQSYDLIVESIDTSGSLEV